MQTSLSSDEDTVAQGGLSGSPNITQLVAEAWPEAASTSAKASHREATRVCAELRSLPTSPVVNSET